MAFASSLCLLLLLQIPLGLGYNQTVSQGQLRGLPVFCQLCADGEVCVGYDHLWRCVGGCAQTVACDAEGCSTCGDRAEYLMNWNNPFPAGLPFDEALGTVAREFPGRVRLLPVGVGACADGGAERIGRLLQPAAGPDVPSRRRGLPAVRLGPVRVPEQSCGCSELIRAWQQVAPGPLREDLLQPRAAADVPTGRRGVPAVRLGQLRVPQQPEPEPVSFWRHVWQDGAGVRRRRGVRRVLPLLGMCGRLRTDRGLRRLEGVQHLRGPRRVPDELEQPRQWPVLRRGAEHGGPRVPRRVRLLPVGVGARADCGAERIGRLLQPAAGPDVPSRRRGLPAVRLGPVRVPMSVTEVFAKCVEHDQMGPLGLTTARW
ncbi:unnamed protein product [Prorocentrum cordatum]|uniref:Uncharacterized protein n=1 Tax=Prorocentrum cordatum TaxID=2364126 RepID=A0ABN9T4K7_9DINO|nr:unnamed protein product [Polarella glacialis]